MPHSHEDGWNPIEISIFADQYLSEGVPLPTIKNIETRGNVIKADITGLSSIQDGYLLFTEDTNPWMNRQWEQASAKLINSDGIEAPIPDRATVCFLAIEDQRGAYVSTPYTEIIVD